MIEFALNSISTLPPSSNHVKNPSKCQIEEFNQAASDYIKEVREKYRGTLQSDWFISSDNSECEIRETWESTEAARLS